MPLIVESGFSGAAPWASTQLQDAIARWLNRTDLTLHIPDFIRLAEDRLQRALRVQQMEALMAPTPIVGGLVGAPTGAVGVKTLWITGYESAPLKPQSYESLLARGTNQIATHYAWVGSTLYFDGPGTLNGIVYNQLPSLATNPSNWLLTEYPSAYLFAALVEAWLFLRNAGEAQAWNARAQQVIDEINGNDARDNFSGPLVAVAR